ncbi:hypothetical protein [Candidatus Viridilinea mediisalina]|uniref:Uncharacterized protein n=1 Tax=Candidatus Viridilinea mediisalina TaxID=2024553 RepID=A0A2A6RJH3_9CHLR|nr:hypothetical protein [Candidatus Viridilinea mediisalina]PDW03274.1 hypothetical protein CJ255_09515 [Candidatus Viridilinea mediisalina]
MAAITNPFVDYLARYTTASPDHEAAFDEFLAQTAPPPGGKLRLTTRVEQFLHACFNRAAPPSIILTGNAGDGKTYLCRQVITAFTGSAVEDWQQVAQQPLVHRGMRLHIVKDLSELGEAPGLQVLHGLAKACQDGSHERYLIPTAKCSM